MSCKFLRQLITTLTPLAGARRFSRDLQMQLATTRKKKSATSRLSVVLALLWKASSDGQP